MRRGIRLLEQRAGLGSSVETMAHALLTLFEPTVDLARADVEHAPLGRRRRPEAFSYPRHPQGQQGLQPHRARIAGRLPDRTQDGDHSGAVGRRTAPPARAFPPGVGCRSVQQTDGVFPVITRVATKFVQDHLLLLELCSTVTRVNHLEIFPSRLPIHGNPPAESSREGYIKNGATGYISKWLNARLVVTK